MSDSLLHNRGDTHSESISGESRVQKTIQLNTALSGRILNLHNSLRRREIINLSARINERIRESAELFKTRQKNSETTLQLSLLSEFRASIELILEECKENSAIRFVDSNDMYTLRNQIQYVEDAFNLKGSSAGEIKHMMIDIIHLVDNGIDRMRFDLTELNWEK